VPLVVNIYALLALIVVVFTDGLIGSIEFSRDLLRFLHFLAISISSSDEEAYY